MTDNARVSAGSSVAPISLLIVDDEAIVLRALTQVFKRAGFDVVAIDDPVEAMVALAEPGIDVALFDIRMPSVSGIDLLREAKSRRPDVEVIMMTAHATVETALAAVRAGAYDYLLKPFNRVDDVVRTVQKAAERRRLIARNRALETMLDGGAPFEQIIGQSGAMQGVFRLIDAVSKTAATVIVRGESGTGKELVARAIHARSDRRQDQFVAVNCSALSESLLESELFGHVRGAFTGALANRKGMFEAASGGTLFLDEIGDISPALQVRLLRVLQEGEIKRVGSDEPVRVDTRVIAATHVDLEQAVRSGRFREDLFYRLNVITVPIPALRERPDDIPLLAHHMLRKHAQKLGRTVQTIASDALEVLVTHGWPGNVRELENVIQRAVILAQGAEITRAELPPGLGNPSARPAGAGPTASGADDPSALMRLPYTEAKRLAVRAFERRYLANAIRSNQGNINQAARAAGIDRSNFRRLLREHDLRSPGSDDDESAVESE